VKTSQAPVLMFQTGPRRSGSRRGPPAQPGGP